MSTNTALDQLKNRVEGHTEGPWAVMDVNDPGEGVNFIDVYSETDGLESVCRLPNPAEYSSREGLQSDAELIAAAPKMLAALEAVEEQIRYLEEIQAGHTSIFESANVSAGSVASALTAAIEEALR